MERKLFHGCYSTLGNGVLYILYVFVFAFVCPSDRKPQMEVEAMKKVNLKNLKFGINNTVIVVFSVVIVMLLNIAVVLLEGKVPNFKLDLTENAVTKIGNETKGVLKRLDEGDCEVDLIYLKGMGDENKQVTTVLEQYDAYSKNIEYKIVNYHTDPVFLSSYGISSDVNIDNSVLVATKDKTKARLVNAADMEATYQNSTVFMLENLVTNAIGVVSSEKSMTVCFTTGHGEIIEQSATEGGKQSGGMMLVALLRSENISVYQYDISTGKIPEGIDAVMIMSPLTDFTQEEINNLDDYLLGGGNVIVSLPSTIALPRIEKYLKDNWGVGVNNNIISETDPQSRFDENGVYFYAQKGAHEAVSDIGGRIIASYMKSLTFSPVGDVEADVLLSSSENALSMPIENNTILSENVTKGRFDLAYMLEKPLGGSFENTAKLVVTAGEAVWGVTREMVTNYDAIVYNSLLEKSFGNADFAMNVLSYVYGEALESIYVPVKTRQVSVLTMSESMANAMSKLLGIVLPLLVIVIGVIVWLKRRNK